MKGRGGEAQAQMFAEAEVTLGQSRSAYESSSQIPKQHRFNAIL
jgi:hypothetical protein